MGDDPINTPLESQPTSLVSRRNRRLKWVGIVVFVMLVLGFGGFFTASALEEHDTFCISCHTVPEVTYYNRAYISLDNPSQPIYDLATAHYSLSQQHNKGEFACINCHRGDSRLGQRISTLALGGRDALIYVLGQEDPTVEKTHTREAWLPNAACTGCHADTLLSLRGLDNHFHSHLPQAAVALSQGGEITIPD